MTPSKKHIPIITVDGPSGTGKGTVCQMLAEHLGWHFLDSGSLYRVLAYAIQKEKIDFADIPSVVNLAKNMHLEFKANLKKGCMVLLEDEDITDAIRTEECGQNASKIAAMPEVRSALLDRQRDFAKAPGLVTDGRDMGTVVFPQANLKIFLYASADERARRRYLQLLEKGSDVSLNQVIEELEKRDARDTARTCSPLKPADDAVLIDTTKLTVEQVFNKVLQLLD